MSGINPAIEAARRVDYLAHEDSDATLGAREALKPIRELHKPRWDNCINACCSGEKCRLRSQVCDHDYDEWPCATAKLIYTSEELA